MKVNEKTLEISNQNAKQQTYNLQQLLKLHLK